MATDKIEEEAKEDAIDAAKEAAAAAVKKNPAVEIAEQAAENFDAQKRNDAADAEAKAAPIIKAMKEEKVIATKASQAAARVLDGEEWTSTMP